MRRAVLFKASNAFVVLCLLASGAAAQAQPSASSAEARSAQFVFVIDDSQSMQRTDPNRLSVFAVEALLSMLDNRDEVSIVRLNGAVQGEQPPSIQPLSRNRKAMENLLTLRGRLANYPGENTTCRSALDQTKRLLEAAYRPGVAQVVVFLTDGECTPAAERPSPAGFLQGLRSHAEGLFQLYLIRFRGESASPELIQLTRMSGGDVLETGSTGATEILHSFASALSQSQGFEAELIDPRAPQISAHRGARRVRILAVAPGGGEGLGLTIFNPEGRPHGTLKRPRTGQHQFPGQQPYRFVAVDYKPGDDPLRIQVTGAGNDWKAVVLPEYRLALRSQFLLGGCDEKEPRPAGGVIEEGSLICVTADLINENGVTVSGDLTGQALQAGLLLRSETAEPGTPLPMDPVGDKARFRLERKLETAGDWVLQPLLSLGLSSHGAIRALQKTIQVSNTGLAVEPLQLRFPTLRPGEERSLPLALLGKWPSAPLRIALRDRADVPSCVTFELNGILEGKSAKTGPGKYKLTVRVAPYCGPHPIEDRFPRRLALVFEGLSQREVEVDFGVLSKIQAPAELALSVRDGEGEIPLKLQGNWQRNMALKGSLAAGAPGWPAEHLILRFTGAGTGRDKARMEKGFAVPPGGGSLRLRGDAKPCCAGGSYATELRLGPATLEGYAPGAPPPEPLIVPVRVNVESQGIWACYGYWILRGLLALLLLLLALYIASMFHNTRLLKPVRVAERLVPLDWTAQGGTVEQKGHRTRVLEMVRRAVSWRRRWTAWIKANPFVFGLPGRSYQESLELYLQPHRDLTRSTALLVPQRGFPEKLGHQPEAFTGRIFATAQGGLSFWGVPDREGRLGRMNLEGAPVARDGSSATAPRELVKLHGSRLLRLPDEWESPEEGRPAGWLVG